MNSEWLSPRKILENYVYAAFSDFAGAEEDLRIAVITGEVRARFQGEIVGPDLRGQIARTVYEDGNPASSSAGY